MRYLAEFRDPRVARALTAQLAEQGRELAARGQTVTIMEVCGSHTMAIARYGIRSLLPAGVNLVSGPGCPVCVTPPGYIDAAIELAERGIHLCSFGDMIPVPGSKQSLGEARATGAILTACYSPADAIDYARCHPDDQVVFLAIGFETTIAPTVALLARESFPDNLALLTAFKLVPPALRALLADPELGIDALLCPAHVSAIIGAEAYREFAGPRGVPCVVAGFEPLDILYGVHGILTQLLAGRSEVENQYSRVVTAQGNRRAQQLTAHFLEPTTATWRGLGEIPASALRLRPAHANRDAQARFNLDIAPGRTPPGCACGEVIKGKLDPRDCPLFATTCRPTAPVGPCMVSAEGSCAAAFQYPTTPGDAPHD